MLIEHEQQTRILARVFATMYEFYGTDREPIAHALKVSGLSRSIALTESLTTLQMLCLECAALLHDIGTWACLREFGKPHLQYQEYAGGEIARELLQTLEVPEEIADRVVFLIRNHHSYQRDGGIVLQILIEADLLAIMDEKSFFGREITPEQAMRDYFRTRGGRELLNTMFGVPLHPAPSEETASI